MDRPDVSVVIVNYRKGLLLSRCLESLYASPARCAFEVIVVDNASEDGTASSLPRRFPAVRLEVNAANAGFARATNQGTALARGELVFWLNPDTVVLPGALDELATFLRSHPDAAAVGPRLVGPDGSLQYSCRTFPSLATALFTRESLARRLWPANPLSRRYLLSNWDHADARAVDWISGAALMTSWRVLDAVGLLDERFVLFNEDVDWCRRAHAAGWAVYYDPAALVVHHAESSGGRIAPRLIIERHRGMFRYYRKHLRRGPWLDIPVAVGLVARAGLQLVTRSRWG